MKQCPECNHKIIDVATACRCGWMQSAAPQLTLIPCDGKVGCQAHASIRVGARNYCAACYVNVTDTRPVLRSPACDEIMHAYRHSKYFRAQYGEPSEVE